jgi:hypothetical protein
MFSNLEIEVNVNFGPNSLFLFDGIVFEFRNGLGKYTKLPAPSNLTKFD